MAAQEGGSAQRAYWSEQIATANRTYERFFTSGDRVVERYRIEKANGELGTSEDQYNMLFSSTETITPTLYAQTPKPEVKPRHRDRTNPKVALSCKLLETCIGYGMDEVDFGDVIEQAVEDYVLPGWGNAWVRYDVTFKDQKDSEGNVQYEDPEKKKPVQVIDFEALGLDYVYWKDILYGPCRVWKECPWVARRVYLTKVQATKRFGAEKANKLQYNLQKDNKSKDNLGDEQQAAVWEIWRKADRTVYWYSDGYADDVLDSKPDPLKLKGFFPCPRPMRAISNTKTFIPRAFFSQYQAQQTELDRVTKRIRYLTDALQVRGVYDASQTALAVLLSPTGGNKMIPVQDWASFLQGGGLKGSVDFVPIDKIAVVLMQLYDARDRLKAEIYEISGFGDIMRGSSKASETLGAQEIKQNWASARLKKMQKEVQRFARDIVRMMGEIIAEQFTDATLAEYSGFDAPDDANLAQQYMEAFQGAVKMLREEKTRCALVDIETDSTILADEEGERKDRLEFLGQIGAFLQQAGPMAMQHPEMRGLLGSLMMFCVRTFPSSRPVEMSFEDFQKRLQDAPAQDPNASKVQGTLQVAQQKSQTDIQIEQMRQNTAQAQIQANTELEQQRMQNEHALAVEEQAIKHLELEIKRVELQIKLAELGVKQQAAATATATAAAENQLAVNDQAHSHELESRGADREDAAFAASREDAAADREIDATQNTD